MTEEESAELIALDREQAPVEFKVPGVRTDKNFFSIDVLLRGKNGTEC